MWVNGYTWMELTDTINRLPVQYGRVNQMGLFPIKGIRSRMAAIEIKNGSLALVPAQAWGGEGYTIGKKQGEMKPFMIPQSVLVDHVDPSDVQDRKKWETDAVTTMDEETAEIVESARLHFDITLEYKRVRALYGIVLDADGVTPLMNMFTTFDMTQSVIDFVFSNVATDIRAVCTEVIRKVEDNLKGDVFSGIRVLCSREFFAALTNHPKVLKVYENTVNATQRLGQDVRAGFEFGSIIFEEYGAKVTAYAPTLETDTLAMIDASTAVAVPMGTRKLFKTYCAPADFNETVNTVGIPFYSKSEPVRFGRGVDIHSQSNTMPIVTQPAAVVKLTMS